jgi:hypothetical protein
MEGQKAMTASPSSCLFNSPLETGVRSAILLDTAYPRGFDLMQLTWLDHLVVHTADIGGPESLHPNVPQRNGELLIRRALVEEGLMLMRRMHVIEAKFTAEGIIYLADDQAGLLVRLIRTNYGCTLKERAKWLVEYLNERGFEHLRSIITSKIGRWAIEFQSNDKRAGNP